MICWIFFCIIIFVTNSEYSPATTKSATLSGRWSVFRLRRRLRKCRKPSRTLKKPKRLRKVGRGFGGLRLNACLNALLILSIHASFTSCTGSKLNVLFAASLRGVRKSRRATTQQATEKSETSASHPRPAEAASITGHVAAVSLTNMYHQVWHFTPSVRKHPWYLPSNDKLTRQNLSKNALSGLGCTSRLQSTRAGRRFCLPTSSATSCEQVCTFKWNLF